MTGLAMLLRGFGIEVNPEEVLKVYTDTKERIPAFLDWVKQMAEAMQQMQAHLNAIEGHLITLDVRMLSVTNLETIITARLDVLQGDTSHLMTRQTAMENRLVEIGELLTGLTAVLKEIRTGPPVFNIEGTALGDKFEQKREGRKNGKP